MNGLFRELLRAGFPVRGSIAHGRVWWDLDAGVFLGEGITRAYDLAESLSVIGIAIAPDLDHAECMSRPVPFALKRAPPAMLRIPLQSKSRGWYPSDPTIVRHNG
jgi:hypothetical protein